MSFITLAAQAQKELDGETLRLKQKEDALNVRSASLSSGESDLEKRLGAVTVSEQDIQNRLEEVVRRELTIRRDGEAKRDLDTAQVVQKEAIAERKEATLLRDEARMDREDLEKRELALSAREKTYKQDLELEVMRNFTFRK